MGLTASVSGFCAAKSAVRLLRGSIDREWPDGKLCATSPWVAPSLVMRVCSGRVFV